MRERELDVIREIHAPGLDLHNDRINKHRIFLGVVHEQIERIGAFAWSRFEKQGRGAVFVNRRQWIESIREKKWERPEDDIFAYTANGTSAVGVSLDPLGKGLEEMLLAYEPEDTFILLVQHPPGDVLSAYWLRPSPSPKHAYETLAAPASNGKS